PYGPVVGHDLGEGRRVPLSVGARPGDRRHPPGALDLKAAALPAERGGLDVRRDTDADDLAARATLRLQVSQAGVVRRRERQLERLPIFARVVDLARHRPARAAVG